VCCSVLQCVVVCCSVLQCVAVCCSVLQCVAVRCFALLIFDTCSAPFSCNILQCNTLQHTATLLQRIAVALACCAHALHRFLSSNVVLLPTLQHTATHCNTLQHAATRCSKRLHTAVLLECSAVALARSAPFNFLFCASRALQRLPS